MNPVLRIAVLAVSIIILCATAHGQSMFIGAGGDFAMPQQSLKEGNKNSFGGTFVVGSRRYCELWPAIRVDYIPWQAKNDTLPHYSDEIDLTLPEIRFFPFMKASTFPLYVQGGLVLSNIDGTDALSQGGLGWSAGVGIAFPYSGDCPSWFFDLSARYSVPNNILRAKGRPLLPSILVTLAINLGI